MLLTLSTTHEPATDLGYLLHKHPGRAWAFERAFGTANRSYRTRQRSSVLPRCVATGAQMTAPRLFAADLRAGIRREPRHIAAAQSYGKQAVLLWELALGLEGLERFVAAEPLRRVHECVFGVLALDSEAIDPWL